MERSNIQRSGSIHSGSSASKNYSNINANLHARVKAFQEQRKLKRSGSVGSKSSNQSQDSSSIQHIVNKPLPPLPGIKVIPNKVQRQESNSGEVAHMTQPPKGRRQGVSVVNGSRPTSASPFLAVTPPSSSNLMPLGSNHGSHSDLAQMEERPSGQTTQLEQQFSDLQVSSPDTIEVSERQEALPNRQEQQDGERNSNPERGCMKKEPQQSHSSLEKCSQGGYKGPQDNKVNIQQYDGYFINDEVVAKHLDEHTHPLSKPDTLPSGATGKLSSQDKDCEKQHAKYEQTLPNEESNCLSSSLVSPPLVARESLQRQVIQEKDKPLLSRPAGESDFERHDVSHPPVEQTVTNSAQLMTEQHQQRQQHNKRVQYTVPKQRSPLPYGMQPHARYDMHQQAYPHYQQHLPYTGHMSHQQKARASTDAHKSPVPMLPHFQAPLNPIRKAPKPPDTGSNVRLRQQPFPSMIPSMSKHASRTQGPNQPAKPKPSLSARRGLKLPPGGMSLKMKQPPQEFASQPLNRNANSLGMAPPNRSNRSNPGSLTNGIQTTSTSSEKQVDTEGTEPSKTSNSGTNSNGGLFAMFSKYVDIKSGSLNFTGKLSLSSQGVDFSNGSSFRITLDELEFIEELGHGNYGTVSKVLHKPTNVMMAMKEVRLELDESKFRQILMELEVLHKCQSPYIVDFYGAFFIEGAVYMCMEFMDGGSLDKSYNSSDLGGIEEPQLAYITDSVVRGLKELKDVHNVIHRDVKPTNILCSASQGSVKLCDFGVSGNLVASLAKTNIGCQSYMAPERIKTLNPDKSTYSVQSDIWSLGLSIVEMAIGAYPYPPETYDNIFSQLSAIVDGPLPRLPADRFSASAQDFVSMCLQKIPERRPTYAALLEHPWLKKYRGVDVQMKEYISERLAKRQRILEQNGESGIQKVLPALHMGGL